MDHFESRNGTLHAEDIPVTELVERYGTPLYVYSKATLQRHYHAFDDALAGLEHMVCYAVKANSNLAVLQTLARLGAGFDIVSGGELQRVLRAGGDAGKVVFSGIGKSEDEIRLALSAGVYCFNVESEYELDLIDATARLMKKRARIAFRVNPDVDAQTHPYISTGLKNNKFGVDIATAEQLYVRASKLEGIEIVGIANHIGSQLLQVSPLLDALDRVVALIEKLRSHGITLRHVDLGGGLGVRYRDEQPIAPSEWAQALRPKLEALGLKVLIEPGRAIAGNAGILVTRVLGLKGGDDKRFAIVDAAMNDLLRPTLYQAWMDIVPVVARHDVAAKNYDIVGPVCESGDWLGKDRELAITTDDLLAVRTAGAYGFTMASNYNTRPRAAEVMVDGRSSHVVRARETFDDLVQGERLLP